MCDLLVVFGNDVLIFSDKACEFKNTGCLALDWGRWFRKAILKSAEQVWGAERWITNHPGRLFLDRACTKPFPLALPDESSIRFHRIVVAHRGVERCRHEVGGSGRLKVDTALLGSGAHFETPFTVGRIDPERGFVHVLDDFSLNTILSTLDTTPDFIRYLDVKEAAIQRGYVLRSAGEEDLLAVYLRQLGPEEEHDFNIPTGSAGLEIEEGAWDHFSAHPQRRAQIAADRGSYLWDALIEKVTHHILTGTTYRATSPEIGGNERVIRILAKEPRVRRRMLSDAFRECMAKTPVCNFRAARLMLPSQPGEPLYVFLFLSPSPEISDDEYRAEREQLLGAYCEIAKMLNLEITDVIGIATETKAAICLSEDFLYIDGRQWTESDSREARLLQEATGILQNATMSERMVYEYPPN